MVHFQDVFKTMFEIQPLTKVSEVFLVSANKPFDSMVPSHRVNNTLKSNRFP